MECVVDRGVTRYSRSVAVVKLKILPVPGKVASTFSIFRDAAPGAPPNSTEYLCSDDGGVGELHRLFVL